jgi:hypothetical protein
MELKQLLQRRPLAGDQSAAHAWAVQLRLPHAHLVAQMVAMLQLVPSLRRWSSVQVREGPL